MDSHLANKCILITGASGGIGLATAKCFAEEGASLALHYNRNPEPVERLSRNLSVHCVALRADLRKEEEAQALFSSAIATFRQIDVLVVNAGIWNPQAMPVHQMPLEQWHDTLEADLTSAFLTCRAFLKHLKDSPREAASIIVVGSTAALFGEAGHADYAAAKAGICYGLTASLKNEIIDLAPRGRVNCVCPGWTDTPMAASHTSDAQAIKKATATMSMKKIATSEDVAAAIVFLASDRLAGHISGAVLPVAGGMEGRLLTP